MTTELCLEIQSLPGPGESREFSLGEFRVVWQTLREGTSRGVERVLVIRGDDFVSLLPTRGMAIEQVFVEGTRFGWDAPLAGPVHPAHVDLLDPSGLGWLDGFTELLCRCGLGNNGSPDFDDAGRLHWPLHGRIGNLPAADVRLAIDSAGGLRVSGTVSEKRMHFWKWRMESLTMIAPDLRSIRIEDRITNDSGAPAGFQMLYHYNIGPPVLGPASRVSVPVSKAVPREAHAGKDPVWNVARPPTPGRWESVWFVRPAFDGEGRSLAVLADRDNSIGTAIRFDSTSGLKCLTLWKNEVAVEDGYVFGLEPGTNWPNRRSFEVDHDRWVRLDPGESRTLPIELQFGIGSEAVRPWLDEVDRIQQRVPPEIVHDPDREMCA